MSLAQRLTSGWLTQSPQPLVCQLTITTWRLISDSMTLVIKNINRLVHPCSYSKKIRFSKWSELMAAEQRNASGWCRRKLHLTWDAFVEMKMKCYLGSIEVRVMCHILKTCDIYLAVCRRGFHVCVESTRVVYKFLRHRVWQPAGADMSMSLVFLSVLSWDSAMLFSQIADVNASSPCFELKYWS